MENSDYRKRIVDEQLEFKLKSKGAVLIEGSKWCGKTTTASQHAKSILYIDTPERRDDNIRLSTLDPSVLLSGDNPRLLDEWQIAPRLFDAVRHEVDRRGKFGQFILTGSAVPKETNEILHSGIGRFSYLLMRPMSLYESGESDGKVSLSSIIKGEEIGATANLTLSKLAFYVCRGGWPISLVEDKEVALAQAVDYVDGLIRSDIHRLVEEKVDPYKFASFLYSYSKNIGTQCPLSKLAKSLINPGQSIDDKTADKYLSALKRAFVVEEMIAWNPNLRTKVNDSVSPRRYLVDPSIAAASLEIGPGDLIRDLKTFGFLFENLAIRDLRIYAEANRGKLYHFRTSKGLECDAVLHIREGEYGLIEIKLGSDRVEEGADALNKVEKKIVDNGGYPPLFKMVLIGVGGYSYRRSDGIYVVSIDNLRP